MLIFKILQIAIPFIWLGMIIAISFVETPLKFRAPNITLALGLGIGKIVFQMLNRVEIVLAILMLISLFATPPSGNFTTYSFAGIFILLLLQTFWLLPSLNVRADQVIAGLAPPFSYNHIIFIVFEVIKLLLLLLAGVNLIKQSLKFEL